MEALREGRRRGYKEEEIEENGNGEGGNKEEEMGEK
jgi:hypothetical protein